MTSITTVVLAAGQGKRMHSDLPKVLHPVAGKPMIEHALDTAQVLSDQDPIVVYGHAGDVLRTALSSRSIVWREQREQLGTGHAVQQTTDALADDTTVLILYGDVPLLRSSTLSALVETSISSGFAVLTVRMQDPSGYGRMVRDDTGNLTRIVEDKDATDVERAIDEINTGIMAVRGKLLKQWVAQLRSDNAQGEYYLTDCVEMAVAEGIKVASVIADDSDEAMGVNNRRQLAEAERIFQRRQANELMDAGVSLIDPDRLDVRGSLKCGRDVVIDINTVFIGDVVVGEGAVIGPNCVISNCEIGAGTQVLSHSVLDSARIGKACRIGPFARIRPDSVLSDEVHVGNFVEVKKSTIGHGSKANHLAYVGDATVGKKVNIGAGTITCNYDGANKHQTVLEDEVFVGSDTQLVAPVRVGRGVTIGAGTTVTEDVEPERLVISRVRQKSISGWQRPVKDKTGKR